MGNSLYNLPGIGPYFAARDRNEQAQSRELGQAMHAMQLGEMMRQSQRRTKLEQMAELAGGDADKLIAMHMQLGDAAGAAQVAQAVETRRKFAEEDLARRTLAEHVASRRQPGMPAQQPQTTLGALDTSPLPMGPGVAPSAPADLSGAPAGMPTGRPVTRSSAVQDQIAYLNGLAESMEAKGLVTRGAQYREQATKLAAQLPKFAATTKTVMTPQGPRIVALNDAGEQMDTGLTPAEKLHFGGDGQRTNMGFDPYTGRVVSGGTQQRMTPGEMAVDARARARLGLDRERLDFDRNRPDLTQPFEATIGGRPVLVQQDRRTGQLVDVNSKQIVSGVGPKTSDGEQMAAGYADRMRKAEQLMGTVSGGQKPEAMEIIGGVLGKPGGAGASAVGANLGRSDERQQYHQAAEDWVRAKLRKESGAVIGDEEMAREIRTFFPVVGDSDAVIRQKSNAREIATRAMEKSSGAAYSPSSAPATAAAPRVDKGSGKSTMGAQHYLNQAGGGR